MPEFLTPTFSFYQDWYWWLLMVIVLATVYVQGVGFNLEQQSGVPRSEFGRMYVLQGIVRLACWILMLFLSGWVSVIASIVFMFIISILIAGMTREHARLIIKQAENKE